MKSLIILIVICFGFTLTLSALHGTEITVGKEWWNENFYLKFNSPRGKTFFIDFNDGAIYRERNSTSTTFGELLPIYTPLQSEVTETQTELDVKKELPFISFVSIDLQIYDIYFDSDGIESQNPRLEKTEFVYQYKYVLIRTSLRSFVGPNKKVYQITYNDANEIDILETSPETLDHFRIKTFGPYEKWEHTYDFSENGELIVDHTISPIPVQADRSIPLLERDPSSIIEQNYIQTFVKFYTASGTKYHITNQLNIVPIRDDVKETAYITFTEPSGRTYDVNIDEKDGSASLVEKSLSENYFGNQKLHSFVTPSGVLYRIDHRNESDHELPILVQDSEIFSELQITLAERNPYYNKFVKYIFSQNGKKLFDRVDEIDWTPLNEQPALPVEEATADYLMGNLPFLTLYTPSGNNYHVVTTDTNASIAVEKGATHSQNLYISYFQTSGRKTHIHFVPGTDPYLKEETESIGNEDEFSFLLLSFTTPDQKEYSIRDTIGDDNKWTPSIQLPTQVKEPIDLRPVDGLSITIQNAEGYRYVYRFTWNGDKLIEFSLEPPRYFADNKALRVLIGK